MDSPLLITEGKMPTVSAINIVRQKQEVLRVYASRIHLREENISTDTLHTDPSSTKKSKLKAKWRQQQQQ